jgi:hypothetical protein
MRRAYVFFFSQPQETFEEWLQAQMQIDFQNQKEQFLSEFQQIPVNYGTIPAWPPLVLVLAIAVTRMYYQIDVKRKK